MKTILALISCSIGLLILTQALTLLLRREYRSRANASLALTAVFTAMWAFSYTFMYTTSDRDLASIGYRAGSPGWTIGFATVTIFFNGLFNSVSGKQGRKWMNAAVLAAGLAFFASALAGKIVAHDFAPAPWGWMEIIDPASPWIVVYGIFIIAAMLNVVGRTVLTWRRARLNKHRLQMRMIGIPFAALTLPTLFVNFLAPIFGVSEVPPVGHLVISCSLFFICQAAMRYRMLTIDPVFAAEALLFDVSDYVFLTDTSGMIRKAGHAAHELLGIDADAITSRNILEIVPGLDLSIPAGFSVGNSPVLYTEIAVSGSQAVPVSCKITEVLDSHRDPMGRLYVMNDLRDIRALEMKTEQLKKTNEHLKHISMTDPLTGIYNRKRMHDELDREFIRFKRNGASFSVIMMDIDHFKNVNDTFGHTMGDDVLRIIAATAASVIRKNDIIARWGGEEFLVLCVETRVAAAMRLAERIRQAIEDSSYPQAIRVTASLGVAEIGPSISIETLINSADVALYESKAHGRNRVTAYSTNDEG